MWLALAACSAPPHPHRYPTSVEPFGDAPGTIRTWLGVPGFVGRGSDGDDRSEHLVSLPRAMGVGEDGTAWVLDNAWVLRVDPDGVVTRVAGGSLDPPACRVDCDPLDANLEYATDLALADDTLWISADWDVYRLDLDQDSLTRVPWPGYPSTFGVADDKVYGGDGQLGVVRARDDGDLAVVAGQEGVSGWSGDGGPAVEAVFRAAPRLPIAVDDRRLVVVDRGNELVRTVDLASGRIDRIAGVLVPRDDGSGEPGYADGGGDPLSARFADPNGVAVAPDGRIFVADTSNHCVRVLADGAISTAVGRCTEPGFSGDGGPADQALLDLPVGVAFGPDGAIYVLDAGNAVVRVVEP